MGDIAGREIFAIVEEKDRPFFGPQSRPRQSQVSFVCKRVLGHRRC